MPARRAIPHVDDMISGLLAAVLVAWLSLSPAIMFLIHGANVATFVYIPGIFRSAHPAPNETMPTNDARLIPFSSSPMYRSGPPLSALWGQQDKCNLKTTQVAQKND
jgi:hypothetical protein